MRRFGRGNAQEHMQTFLQKMDDNVPFLGDDDQPTEVVSTGHSPIAVSGLPKRARGLEEADVLQGLLAGPTFLSTSMPFLSDRFGDSSRRQMFSLLPSSLSAETVSLPSPPVHTYSPVMKAFRRTLQVVSGFRLRMRTAFVSQFLSSQDPFPEDSTPEDLATGNALRTAILCIEIENTGEAEPGTGFMIESADVAISGGSASVSLIGLEHIVQTIAFPLHLRSMEQCNLLYAVSFLHSPDDDNPIRLTSDMQNTNALPRDLRRTVIINIRGWPIMPAFGQDEPGSVSHPTQAYSSSWNCVLDLSSVKPSDVVDLHVADADLPYSALPDPRWIPGTFCASPFEVGGNNSLETPVAGNRRHTITSLTDVSKAKRAVRSTTSFYDIHVSSPVTGLSVQHNSPTKSMIPSIASPQEHSPLTPLVSGAALPTGVVNSRENVSLRNHEEPMTPAYPAYSAAAEFFPAHVHNALQHEMDAKTEFRHKTNVNPSLSQMLVGQFASGTRDTAGLVPQDGRVDLNGEPLVISVGLLKAVQAGNLDRVFPLDRFSVQIFVFNRSSWTRRFEIAHPCQRRLRWAGQQEHSAYASKLGHYPGVLPLDNRITTGSLRPSTCQLIRMDFLAVLPGVHTINVLTLSDVESGSAINLRAVMDVVIHEPLPP